MSFDLAEVFRTMQPFAMAIVAVLALMAMAALSVSVERMWVYYRSRKKSREFGARAAQLLSRGEHDKVIGLAKDFPQSHLAGLISSGMKTYVAAVKNPGELGAMELTRRELLRRTEQVSSDVRRGHNVLASVGSISPFVGLLGTVIGIISAFQGIAAEGSGGLGAVSAGIAEALIVTAIGLIVAIPSVLAFNYLAARSDALLLALDSSKGEFLDFLENQTRDTGGSELSAKPSTAKTLINETGHGEVRVSATA